MAQQKAITGVKSSSINKVKNSFPQSPIAKKKKKKKKERKKSWTHDMIYDFTQLRTSLPVTVLMPESPTLKIISLNIKYYLCLDLSTVVNRNHVKMFQSVIW